MTDHLHNAHNRRMRIQPNITFAMIKSDAFINHVDDQILAMIREHGFSLIHAPARKTRITATQFSQFYQEHTGRPYFNDLYTSVRFDVMPMILEHTTCAPAEAFSRFRTLMGATMAKDALPGTIRAAYAGCLRNAETPVAANAIHGSDSLQSALREIGIIFGKELVSIRSLLHGEFFLEDFIINAE